MLEVPGSDRGDDSSPAAADDVLKMFSASAWLDRSSGENGGRRDKTVANSIRPHDDRTLRKINFRVALGQIWVAQFAEVGVVSQTGRPRLLQASCRTL